MKCTECGNEIPKERQIALSSIGGTDKCYNCAATEEAKKKAKGVNQILRPSVAQKLHDLNLPAN